jgi:hypothetical protein
MKQISFATNESKHLKNKHERERSKTKSLGSERLDKKKKLGGILRGNANCVPKNWRGFVEEQKRAQGTSLLLALSKALGGGAKPTRKTKNVHEKKREGNYTDLE